MATLSSDAAQLQAARATIAEALAVGRRWDELHVRGRAHAILTVLSRADTSAHDAAILAAKADGWDEACQALAWCFDNGPERNALPYMIEHNPFSASIEQTEAE